MGTQFTPNSIPRNIINMKFLIGFTIFAVATAVPIELTADVAQATKEHLAAHAAASAGEHAHSHQFKDLHFTLPMTLPLPLPSHTLLQLPKLLPLRPMLKILTKLPLLR